MAKTKDGYDPVAGLTRLVQRDRIGAGTMYSADQYQYEKLIGVRKPSGETNLKKLNGRHRAIIAYHLRCLSNSDIAFLTGHSENAISRILRDPLSQAYIQEHLNNADAELNALVPMAVDAVRQGLQDGNINVRLKSADKFFRATGKYNENPVGNRETAEDVIARALDALQQQAGAINQLSRPDRSRAIEAHVEDVPYEEVIEDGRANSEQALPRVASVDMESDNR